MVQGAEITELLEPAIRDDYRTKTSGAWLSPPASSPLHRGSKETENRNFYGSEEVFFAASL